MGSSFVGGLVALFIGALTKSSGRLPRGRYEDFSPRQSCSAGRARMRRFSPRPAGIHREDHDHTVPFYIGGRSRSWTTWTFRDRAALGSRSIIEPRGISRHWARRRRAGYMQPVPSRIRAAVPAMQVLHPDPRRVLVAIRTSLTFSLILAGVFSFRSSLRSRRNNRVGEFASRWNVLPSAQARAEPFLLGVWAVTSERAVWIWPSPASGSAHTMFPSLRVNAMPRGCCSANRRRAEAHRPRLHRDRVFLVASRRGFCPSRVPRSTRLLSPRWPTRCAAVDRHRPAGRAFVRPPSRSARRPRSGTHLATAASRSPSSCSRRPRLPFDQPVADLLAVPPVIERTGRPRSCDVELAPHVDWSGSGGRDRRTKLLCPRITTPPSPLGARGSRRPQRRVLEYAALPKGSRSAIARWLHRDLVSFSFHPNKNSPPWGGSLV